MSTVAVGAEPDRSDLLGKVRRWREDQRFMRYLVLFFGLAVAVLTMLVSLPVRATGQLDDGRLTRHEAAICGACPPAQRIEGAGLLDQYGRYYVTVRMAQPPNSVKLAIQFAGKQTPLRLAQAGRSWSVQATTGSDVPYLLAQAAVAGNDVVVSVPASFATSGVTVSTDAGDRLPASGFVPLQFYSTGPNWIDLVVVVLAGWAAWVGWRRGFMSEAGRFLAAFMTVAGTFVLFPVVVFLLSLSIQSHLLRDALTYAILLAAIAVAAQVFGRRYAAPLQQWAVGALGDNLPPIDRPLGAAAAALRVLAVAAMALTLALTLASLSVVGDAALHSWLGSTLVRVWVAIFPICQCA